MKKKSALLSTILFGSLFSYAANMTDAEKVIIRSPQVADMMRFDKVGGVSKLSGRLDFSVEVARIKDKDFDLPVTLSYNSAGFMPSKPESYVGLNWSLSAGGAMTRACKIFMRDSLWETTT